MPDFPSNTPVDAIDRLRTENDLQRRFLSPNLLINPHFRHIDWPEFDVNPFGNQPDWLRYSPGWFPLGVPDGPDAGVTFGGEVTDSPFGPKSGVEFTAAQDRWGGLIQELPHPGLIRGRRVRISGCFRNTGSEGTSGISVYLKGKKAQSNVPAGVSWEDGGLGKVGPKAPATAEAVIAMFAGTGAAFGSTHPVNVPLFDALYEDGPSRYLRLNGGESAAASGSVVSHGVTLYTFKIGPFSGTGLSGVPATDGSLLLASKPTLGVDGLYYFEAFADVPDDGDLFEDDVCHIVVLPYFEATAVGGMGGPTTLTLYALSLEVVLDEANVEDRLLYGSLMGSVHSLPFGDAAGRLDAAYLLRNPIYVPKVVPLLQGQGHHQQGAGGTLGPDTAAWPQYDVDGIVQSATPDASIGIQRSVVGPSANPADPFFWSTPNLPPGSSILRGSITTEVDNSGSNVVGYFRVYQVCSFLPTGETIPTNENADLVLNLENTVIGGTSEVTTTRSARARRNRTGLYWNHRTADTLANGTLAAAEHVFHMALGANVVVRVLGGWLVVASDPRLAGAAFGQEP